LISRETNIIVSDWTKISVAIASIAGCLMVISIRAAMILWKKRLDGGLSQVQTRSQFERDRLEDVIYGRSRQIMSPDGLYQVDHIVSNEYTIK
jgi:hypothetical protein